MDLSYEPLSNFTNEIRSKFQAMNSDISKLKNSGYNDYDYQIQEIRTQIKILRKLLNQIQVDGVDEEFVNRMIQNATSEITTSINEILEDLNVINSKIIDLSNDVNANVKNISDNKKSIELNVSNIADNKKAIQSNTSDISSNTKEISRVETSTSKDISELNDKLKEIEKKINETNSDDALKQLEDKLSELQKQLDRLNDSKKESDEFYSIREVISTALTNGAMAQLNKYWLNNSFKNQKVHDNMKYATNWNIIYNVSLNEDKTTIKVPVWSTYFTLQISREGEGKAKIVLTRGDDVSNVTTQVVTGYNMHSVDITIQFSRAPPPSTKLENVNDFTQIGVYITTTQRLTNGFNNITKPTELEDILLLSRTWSTKISYNDFLKIIWTNNNVYAHVCGSQMVNQSPLSSLALTWVENDVIMKSYTDVLLNKAYDEIYNNATGGDASLVSLLSQLMLTVDRLTVDTVRKLNVTIVSNSREMDLSLRPNVSLKDVTFMNIIQYPSDDGGTHSKYNQLRQFGVRIKDAQQQNSYELTDTWTLRDNGTLQPQSLSTSVNWKLNYNPSITTTMIFMKPDNNKSWVDTIIIDPKHGAETAVMNPNYNGGNKETWFTFEQQVTHEVCLLTNLEMDSNSTVTITITPSNALPSVALIQSVTYVNIRDSNGTRQVPIQWNINKFIMGGIEELRIVGTISLRDIIKGNMCYYEYAKFTKQYETSNRRINTQFYWRDSNNVNPSGTYSTTTQQTLTEGGKLYAEVTMQVLKNTDFPSNFNEYKTNNASFNFEKFINIVYEPYAILIPNVTNDKLPTQWRSAYRLAIDGIYDNLGVKVKIILPEEIVDCTYIRDPIGIGRVSYTDLDKELAYTSIMNLQSQVMNLTELVNEHTKRLEMLDATLAKMNGGSTAGMLLSSLATITSFINPLAGIAISMVATVVSTIEMLESGITAQGAINVTTDLVQIIVGLKVALNKPNNFVKTTMVTKTDDNGKSYTRGKYDVAAATADAMKQLSKHKMEKIKYTKLVEDIPINGMLKNYDVEHLYRPMEMFESKTKFFSDLTAKVKTETANASEKAIYNALSKSNIYPAHQFMRLSNFEKDGDRIIKNVWVYGLSDGYATPSSAHLIGTNKHQFYKLNSLNGNEIGPGVWKMRMEKDVNGEYNFLPYRTSGMTNEQILVAGGLTSAEAKKFIATNDEATVNSRVEHVYAIKSASLINEYDMSVTKKFDMMLMDGQLDALTKTLLQSAPSYNYTLIGNNCQNYVSSITKLLKDPTNKPNWMSQSDYLGYMKALDTNFSDFS